MRNKITKRDILNIYDIFSIHDNTERESYEIGGEYFKIEITHHSKEYFCANVIENNLHLLNRQNIRKQNNIVHGLFIGQSMMEGQGLGVVSISKGFVRICYYMPQITLHISKLKALKELVAYLNTEYYDFKYINTDREKFNNNLCTEKSLCRQRYYHDDNSIYIDLNLIPFRIQSQYDDYNFSYTTAEKYKKYFLFKFLKHLKKNTNLKIDINNMHIILLNKSEIETEKEFETVNNLLTKFYKEFTDFCKLDKEQNGSPLSHFIKVHKIVKIGNEEYSRYATRYTQMPDNFNKYYEESKEDYIEYKNSSHKLENWQKIR